MSWQNYSFAPGVILYDFIPSKLSLALESLAIGGTMSIAFAMLQQASAVATATSAELRGAATVQASNSLRLGGAGSLHVPAMIRASELALAASVLMVFGIDLDEMNDE